MRPVLSIVASSLMILTVVACSSSSTGTTSGGTSGGNAPLAASDCSPRCTSKATGCGASSDQASSSCQQICASTTTQQITCLEGKSCSDLMTMDLNMICPKGDVSSSGGTTSGGMTSGSTGGGAALGASCTCSDVGANASGFCKGTGMSCSSELRCIYASGSMGKGTCFADSCCDDTTACDADKSKLKPCSTGSCQSTAVGYYCGK